MNVTEAKAGFDAAVKDICGLIDDLGLEIESKCAYSNADEDGNAEQSLAECIFADIIIKSKDSERALVLNSAVGIFENDEGERYVSVEELSDKVAELRTTVKNFKEEITATSQERGCAIPEAFDEYVDPKCEQTDAESVQKSGGYDNKKFYIVATIVAVAVLAISLLLKAL